MGDKPQVTIYHNPRCSKSRQTLNLLRDRAVEPRVIEYLEHPPDEKTLRHLIERLGVRPIDLVRRKEEPFRSLGLDEKKEDGDALIKAMVRHPILIERPIVVRDRQARLGRPPENVLELLED